MAETTTFRKLLQMLKSGSLKEALAGSDENISLVSHLDALIAQSNLSPTQLADKLYIDRSFFYQIRKGIRPPSRDLLIRLAFILRLSLDDTQRLLTIADYGILYTRSRRDMCAMYAINNKYTLERANDALVDEGEKPLIPPLKP